MTTILGANLKIPEAIQIKANRGKRRDTKIKEVPKPLKPYFLHPSTKERVYVMLDACHMLKLARNLLAMPEGIMVSGFKIPAKWKYIEALFELQNKTGFRLGNKKKSLRCLLPAS